VSIGPAAAQLDGRLAGAPSDPNADATTMKSPYSRVWTSPATHLRPEYLREFNASTEAFWEAVGEFTDAHLRYQRDTNIIALTGAWVRRTA